MDETKEYCEMNTPASVCDLFREQVRRNPDRIAVVDGHRQLSYAELENRARQISMELLVRNVGPEQVVAISLRPAAEMIAGVLGILFAGAAYLPIDPATPAQRVRLMMEDASATALVTTADLQVADTVPAAIPVIFLGDRTEFREDLSPVQDPIQSVAPGQLAYVIYTSGSSGYPKGVGVEHRSMSNLIRMAGQEFEFGQFDVVPLFHSFAFDVSIWEIWTALAYGGRLVIVPAGEKDPVSMVRLLHRHQITVLNQTPTAYGALLPELARTGLKDLPLRLVIFAGEQVNDEVLRRSLALEGCPVLVNMYGITEVTVHATIQHVSHEVLASHCPVGAPFLGASIVVLGDDLEIAPVGVVGEIYVGGAGVARGYVGRARLTAERFVPHPWSEGARLYRSGDSGRYLADGSIDCLGRIDEQVKVRGFRVEPREVEANLLRFPAVEEALVVARGDPGARRLTAYLVTSREQPTTTALRSFLRLSLPSYMVPNSFVFLDTLPRTSNGKADVRALPDPQARPSLQESLVRPSTSTQRTLSSIWASVLQLEEVGIDDDFLELGGDSILAVRLVARARTVGFRFGIRDVFDHPTVRRLCASIGEIAEVGAGDHSEVSGQFPLTPVQQQLVDIARSGAERRVQSVVIHSSGRIEVEWLRRRLTAVVGHHDILRSRLRLQTRGSHGVIPGLRESGLEDAIVIVDVADDDDQSPATAADELTATLDQSRGLLIAAAVLRGSDALPDRIVLVIDHLAVDLVSWHFLVEDILATTPRLPVKTTSFPHWVDGLVDLGESAELQAELPYWSAVLESASNVCPLQPSAGAAPSRRVTRRLAESVTTELIRVTSTIGRPNEVVLAALARSYVSCHGGTSMWADVEAHGRDELIAGIDVSRTVGCFTVVFPVVIDVPTTDGLAELVKRVAGQLESVPSGGTGFGLLRDRGALDDATPEICVNFLGRIDAASWQPMLLSFDDESLNCRPQQVLGYPLEITAGILHGELVLDFAHSAAVSDEDVSALADGVLEHLTQLRTELTSDAGANDASQAAVETYPATGLQQALVFQSAVNPGIGMYVAQSTLELLGDLDVAVLHESIAFVVARNPILRTRFEWENTPVPLQVVVPDPDTPFCYADWTGLAPEAIAAKCAGRLHDDRVLGVDLSAGHLLRFACVRTAGNVHLLLVSAHHALLDGWSFSLLLADIMSAYRSLADERSPKLPERLPFRSYVEWLGAQDYEEARRVWLDELHGAVPRRLSLTWTSHSDKTMDDVGERHEVINESQALVLSRFCSSNRLTPSSVLQCAWALTLAHEYGTSDFLVGVVTSTRPPDLQGAEEALGLLVETVPVRVRIDAEQQVDQWLRQEQERQVRLREYGFASLQRMYSWLDLSPGNELFDTLFTYRNFPAELVREDDGPAGLRARVLEPPFTRRTGYAVVAAPRPGVELDLAIFYEPDHISEQQADRMISRYRRTVRAILSSPNQPISALR